MKPLLPILVLALVAGHARAEVYARIDPVSGMTVLSNVRPAPALATASVARRAAAFPRVDAAQQKERDGLRREILETELGGERQALAAATSRRAAADVLQRHVANVEALQRELAGLR